MDTEEAYLILEAIAEVARQLERLNNNIEEAMNENGDINVRVSGGINTHDY